MVSGTRSWPRSKADRCLAPTGSGMLSLKVSLSWYETIRCSWGGKERQFGSNWQGHSGHLCACFVYMTLGLDSPGSSAIARKSSKDWDKSKKSSGLQIIFRPEIVLPNIQREWWSRRYNGYTPAPAAPARPSGPHSASLTHSFPFPDPQGARV